MAGRKVFTSGEILTASDVNSFLMDQVVAVFADDAARSSAIPSPSEGMVTYLEDSNQIQVFNGSAFGPVGGVLQVVQQTFSTEETTTSSTFVDTSLSATITPASTGSKVLCLASLVGQVSRNHPENSGIGRHTIARDGTQLNIEAGNLFQIPSSSGVKILASQVSMSVLDLPATTSPTTYTVQHRVASADSVTSFRFSQEGTLILMEIAG